MKLLGFERALCLSPHPDDVEYGMAGTILKYGGTEFTVACLSTGSPCDPTAGEARQDEVRAFWTGVGNAGVCFPGKQHLDAMAEDKWIAYLESELDVGEYDALFVPPGEDYHCEHRLVHAVGRAMVRHHAVALVEYRTASALAAWVPNLFVAVDGTYAEKLRRWQAFGSQNGHRYMSEEALEIFHANYHAVRKGLGKMELYRVVEMYG